MTLPFFMEGVQFHVHRSIQNSAGNSISGDFLGGKSLDLAERRFYGSRSHVLRWNLGEEMYYLASTGYKNLTDRLSKRTRSFIVYSKSDVEMSRLGQREGRMKGDAIPVSSKGS